MTPSLQNLKYLVALKKTNHFSMGAAECNVSPSTFSAGISKLEQNLQAKLVERDNKNVLFTPIGNKVVNQASAVLAEVHTLIATAKQDFFASEIIIGVIPTISTYILPSFLSNLVGAYPELKASFKEDTSDNLLQQLDNAQIDLAIFAFPYDLPQSIEYLPIIQDSIHFIHHKDRNTHALENGSLLMLEQGHCLRSHILQINEISSQHISKFSCTSISTLVAMVDMNVGVSFLPKLAIDYGTLSNYPNIKVQASSSKAKREIGLIYRKNNPHKESIKKLANLLSNK